jgi:hypothetical protein
MSKSITDAGKELQMRAPNGTDRAPMNAGLLERHVGADVDLDVGRLLHSKNLLFGELTDKYEGVRPCWQ